jgi:hypothetical protein
MTQQQQAKSEKCVMQFRCFDNNPKGRSPASAGKAQEGLLIPHKTVTFVLDA